MHDAQTNGPCNIVFCFSKNLFIFICDSTSYNILYNFEVLAMALNFNFLVGSMHVWLNIRFYK